MKLTKRVTIKDIAANTGVSKQTVSPVLNNHPDVSLEPLERVKKVIKETGYSPNALARSLIRGRSHMLGVVAYSLKYYGPSRMITGIGRRAAELGYSMFLHLIHDPETNDIENQINSLLAHQVDGIIWAIPEIRNNRSWAHNLRQDFNVPLVFVGGMEKPISLFTVGIDNHAIGMLATQYLINRGARSIGIITGLLNWWEAQQRQQGWRDVLRANGMEDKEKLVAVGDWNAASGEQAYHQLFKQDSHIDAIFASNDQMACGVLHAAHREGWRIPEDLSIVGVDNIPEGAHF
jgi:LacI family transcriptional regulator